MATADALLEQEVRQVETGNAIRSVDEAHSAGTRDHGQSSLEHNSARNIDNASPSGIQRLDIERAEHFE